MQRPELEKKEGMTAKHIEAVYDSYAWVYDLLFGSVFRSGRERAPVLLKLFPGAKVLEVGVGTGLSLPDSARASSISLGSIFPRRCWPAPASGSRSRAANAQLAR